MQVSLPCQISLPELTNTYYPFNSSLEDEMKRLFVNCCTIDTTKKPEPPKLEDIMEDFRQNGRDYEYCPDLGKDSVAESPSSSLMRRKKINRRPAPTECVFCRNNGEEESYYKGHVLKDTQGRVLCPVLRAYTCPICGANGDHAHTLKYCPKGLKKTETAAPNAFKQTRNAVGRRRHPINTRAYHKT